MTPATDNHTPAFPTMRPALDPRASEFYTDSGMSLRDWFAGMAMQGMAANSANSCTEKQLCQAAYMIADAMMVERTKGTT